MNGLRPIDRLNNAFAEWEQSSQEIREEALGGQEGRRALFSAIAEQVETLLQSQTIIPRDRSQLNAHFRKFVASRMDKMQHKYWYQQWCSRFLCWIKGVDARLERIKRLAGAEKAVHESSNGYDSTSCVLDRVNPSRTVASEENVKIAGEETCSLAISGKAHRPDDDFKMQQSLTHLSEGVEQLPPEAAFVSNPDCIPCSDASMLGANAEKPPDPLSFLGQPLEIQHLIDPLLSFNEMSRLRRVNKQIRQNIDTDLQQLDVQFKGLNELARSYAENKSEKIKGKFESCLDAILGHEELNEFLSTHSIHQGIFFTYLTSEGCIPIDWEQKHPKIQKAILDLFLTHASDDHLVKFIGDRVCHFVRDTETYDSYKLAYPSLAKIFFKGLTDQQAERLAASSLITRLLLAMGCTKIHSRLIEILYETDPNAEMWDNVRYKRSNLPSLLPHVWLLDTLALLKSSPQDNSLPVKLNDLFGRFKFFPPDPESQSERESVREFARLFLISAKSLDVRQLKAVAYGLVNTAYFQYQCHGVDFMRALFSFSEKLSDSDSVLVPLLKEFVSLTVASGDRGLWVHETGSLTRLVPGGLFRRDHFRAFIEEVKDSPEPCRTLYLSLLVREPYSYGGPNISTEEIIAAFASCELNYHDYPSFSNLAFHHASHITTRKYFEDWQKLDGAERLTAFLSDYYSLTSDHAWKEYLSSEAVRGSMAQGLNREQWQERRVRHNHSVLRSLVGGIVFSQNLKSAPPMNDKLIERGLTARRIKWDDSHRQPIQLTDFLLTLRNKEGHLS